MFFFWRFQKLIRSLVIHKTPQCVSKVYIKRRRTHCKIGRKYFGKRWTQICRGREEKRFVSWHRLKSQKYQLDVCHPLVYFAETKYMMDRARCPSLIVWPEEKNSGTHTRVFQVSNLLCVQVMERSVKLTLCLDSKPLFKNPFSNRKPTRHTVHVSKLSPENAYYTMCNNRLKHARFSDKMLRLLSNQIKHFCCTLSQLQSPNCLRIYTPNICKVWFTEVPMQERNNGNLRWCATCFRNISTWTLTINEVKQSRLAPPFYHFYLR